MSDAARNPDDYCYRHPDRQSFVLCERCGRTICLECQHHQDGHVYCPDDAVARVSQLSTARKARAKRVRQRPAFLDRLPENSPLVTYGILAFLVLLFIVDTILRNALLPYLTVQGTSALRQPWTLITAMFYPGSILTLLLSGVNLYFIGRILEPHYGRSKYFILYVVSGFSAAVFAFLLDGSSGSAYGAIVGLIGALLIVARRLGANPLFLYITCALSAVLAIVFGSWQAFLGGFLAGAAVAAIYLIEDDARRVGRARLLLVVLGVLLVGLAFARALFFLGA
jgi:membrane associated rhomboid family serine protease